MTFDDERERGWPMMMSMNAVERRNEELTGNGLGTETPRGEGKNDDDADEAA